MFWMPLIMAGAQMAIGTASALAKHSAASADASENAYAEAAMQAQQAYNAEVARNFKWDALQRRQSQEHDAAVAALLDNDIRAMKVRATAETQAAAAGVAGNSVESIARDYFRQQGRIDSATIKNTQMSIQQLQEEKLQAEMERVQRATFAPIKNKQPSILGLGLEIAGHAVNAASTYGKAGGFGGKG